MTQVLDPLFAEGVRRALVGLPSRTGTSFARRSHRTWLIGGLGLLLVGTGGVAAAVLLGQPGGQVVTSLSTPVSVSGNGDGVVGLGTPPAGANAVQFDFTCLTPGTFKIGPSGTEIVCGPQDVGSRSNSSLGQVALSDVLGGKLSVVAGLGQEWNVTAEYVANEIEPLAVNANGETYGSTAYGKNPDLISAAATNGREGYVRRTELDSATGQAPTSPSQSIANQNAESAGSTYIPVYESDGATVIGEFEVSR